MKTYDFKYSGGNISLKVKDSTNNTWNVYGTPSWCIVTKNGNDLSIKVQENSSHKERKCTLRVSNKCGASEDISITQGDGFKGYVYEYELLNTPEEKIYVNWDVTSYKVTYNASTKIYKEYEIGDKEYIKNEVKQITNEHNFDVNNDLDNEKLASSGECLHKECEDLKTVSCPTHVKYEIWQKTPSAIGMSYNIVDETIDYREVIGQCEVNDDITVEVKYNYQNIEHFANGSTRVKETGSTVTVLTSDDIKLNGNHSSNGVIYYPNDATTSADSFEWKIEYIWHDIIDVIKPETIDASIMVLDEKEVLVNETPSKFDITFKGKEYRGTTLINEDTITSSFTCDSIWSNTKEDNILTRNISYDKNSEICPCEENIDITQSRHENVITSLTYNLKVGEYPKEIEATYTDKIDIPYSSITNKHMYDETIDSSYTPSSITVTPTVNVSMTESVKYKGTIHHAIDSSITADYEIEQLPNSYDIIFVLNDFAGFDKNYGWSGYNGTELTSSIGSSIARNNINYVYLSDKITAITDNALLDATNLKGVQCGGDINTVTSQTNIEISENITTIGANAFKNCKTISGINLENAEQLETIGNNAFENCSSVTYVNFDEISNINSIGNEAFKNCSKISSFTIPDSVVSFGTNVFSGDTALTYVKFGSGLTEANKTMLNGAYNVDTIHVRAKKVGDFSQGTIRDISFPTTYPSSNNVSLPTKETTYSTATTAGYNITSLTIDDTVEEISSKCFANHYHLRELTIKENLKAKIIEPYAFCNCYVLKSVIIPSSITTIEHCAFYYCSASTQVVLPETLTTIKQGAFYANTWVTNITIPSSVTTIEKYAFAYCLSDNNLIFETSEDEEELPLTIGDCAFSNNYRVKTEILNSLETPKRAASIGIAAFAENQYASGLVIHSNEESGTTIGSSAFSHCASATELTIDNYVKSIGEYSFQYCYLVPSVNIPESVTSITRNPWIYCPSITSMVVENTNEIYTSRYGNDACNCIMPISDTITVVQAGCKNTVIHQGITTCSEQSFMGNIYGGYTSGNGYYALETNKWNGFLSPLTSITYNYTTIKFPDSLVTIENYAFYDDNCLSSVTNSSNTIQLGKQLKTINTCAFAHTAIQNINLPNTVESIGNYAFFNSVGSHIHIPTSLSSCGFGNGCVFCYCNVETIDGGSSYFQVSNNNVYDDTTLVLGSSSGATHILTSTTKIAKCACHGNDLITTLNIPNNVTIIGAQSYAECGLLTTLTLGNSVETIDDHAFYSDYYLDNVTMPNSLKTIDEYAFNGCSSLIDLSLNNGLVNIKSHAFDGCSKIKEIFIPNTVESIGNSAFYYCSSASALTLSTNSKCTNINYNTFSECDNLTNVTIPSNITNVYYAFTYCSKLTSVTFETTSDLTIDSSSFYSCIKLQTVTFNTTNNLTLSSYSFGYCSALESIYSKAENPSDIATTTFYNIKNGGKLHVPSGKKDTYAQWMEESPSSSYNKGHLGDYSWTIEDDNNS